MVAKKKTEFKHELGSKVRDRVTGMEGVIIGRSEWLYGCLTYSVTPLELKDGRPQDSVGFDEDRLEIVKAAPPHKVKETGGPAPSPAKSMR